MSQNIKCPKCPGTYRADQSKCPFCGHSGLAGPTPAMPRERTCPRCAEAIRVEAVVCKYCGHDFEKARKETAIAENTKYGCVGCLSVFVIIFTALFLIGQFRSPETASDRCNDRAAGFVVAQQYIRVQLKAPSTAKFPSIVDAGNASTPETVTGGCGFIVDTYVDAEDSFGAMIRTRYTVTVAPRDDDRWELIHFEEH